MKWERLKDLFLISILIPYDIVCENPQVCCGRGTLGLTNNQNPAAARVSLGLTNSKILQNPFHRFPGKFKLMAYQSSK